MYNLDYYIWMVILCFPFLLLLLKYYNAVKRDMIMRSFKKWQVVKLTELGLCNDGKSYNNSGLFLVNGSYSFMIYTNDKKLYFFDTTKLFTEIKLEDILDIKIDTITNTQNVKKLVALTSTYNSNSVAYANFTIITKSINYTAIYTVNDVNDLNRCKLILQEDISKLNSTNN